MFPQSYQASPSCQTILVVAVEVVAVVTCNSLIVPAAMTKAAVVAFVVAVETSQTVEALVVAVATSLTVEVSAVVIAVAIEAEAIAVVVVTVAAVVAAVVEVLPSSSNFPSSSRTHRHRH